VIGQGNVASQVCIDIGVSPIPIKESGFSILFIAKCERERECKFFKYRTSEINIGG